MALSSPLLELSKLLFHNFFLNVSLDVQLPALYVSATSFLKDRRWLSEDVGHSCVSFWCLVCEAGSSSVAACKAKGLSSLKLLISETIHTDYKIKLLHLCAGREAVVGFFQGCACERAFRRL